PLALILQPLAIQMPLEDDFCDIVKKARTGQGLSVADVARTTGLPAGDLMVLERGGRSPTKAEVRTIATALGLIADRLTHIALDGWVPAPTPKSVTGVETVFGDIGGYEVKGYVVHDSGEAVLIDTGYNAARMPETLRQRRP